jgi:hypothetical protein
VYKLVYSVYTEWLACSSQLHTYSDGHPLPTVSMLYIYILYAF